MKKQTKIIIGIVLAIAIIILVVSLVYPPVFKGITSGTFGKADKYHKEQMTEKDVQLRSEFVQDTGQLRSMIQGLIYFSLFSQNLSYTIDTCVRSFQAYGICTEKNNTCQNMSILEDYSVFIKNNTKTLNTTVRMLTDFYLKDTTDQTVDVEKNLRDFGNYVNQLNERDSVVENALRSMDGYLLGPSMKETKKAELAQLKSIRDQLLIKGIQLAGLLQDKPLSSGLIGYALQVQPELGKLTGFTSLSVALTNEAVVRSQTFNATSLDSYVIKSQSLENVSGDQLGIVLQSSDLSGVARVHGDLSSGLIGSVVVYDKPSLCFALCNGQQLQVLYSNQLQKQQLGIVGSVGTLGVVAYCSQTGLQLFQSAFDLKSAYSSLELGSALQISELERIVSAQTFGSVSYGTQFVGVIHELGSMGYVQSLGSVSDR